MSTSDGLTVGWTYFGWTYACFRQLGCWRGREDGVRTGRGGHGDQPAPRHPLPHQAVRRERAGQEQGGQGTTGRSSILYSSHPLPHQAIRRERAGQEQGGQGTTGMSRLLLQVFCTFSLVPKLQSIFYVFKG